MKVDERHICYAEFARMINRSRTSLYHIFEAKTVDIDLLILIGKVLDYDFIRNIYMNGPQCMPPHEVVTGASACRMERASWQPPFICLPVNDGGVDLSGLPDCLLDMLRKAVS